MQKPLDSILSIGQKQS